MSRLDASSRSAAQARRGRRRGDGMSTGVDRRAPWRALAGIGAGAGLFALYAQGGAGFLLGFVALVPWLLVLDRARGFAGAAWRGLLMAVAFVVAVFSWFGAALDAYTGIGGLAAVLVLAACAPLLQPQLLAFALVRHAVGRRHDAGLRALAGACAFVGTEWLWPKLLGDTLGHGLLPSAWLRQSADLGGAAGLTFALILVNESLAHAIARRREGARASLAPLGFALALPIVLAGYGAWRLDALRTSLAEPAPSLRIGLVQSALVDYERRRAEVGAYAVVREVLDTHFALSRAALEHHGVDALLWSETVYPTTFAQPRSEDGAALDREILDFATAAGAPIVFGTYDRDDAGEYNAAAFIEPGGDLLGFYRKTHPFPLTEHVPAWLDMPWLRRALPWLGTWQPGDGARVLPLRAADGRELNVVPLICLDDVRPRLALDGARLGAQAIIGLSNDSWFSTRPIGARLHLAVAAFRSIETRMPQVRVTSNGLSAVIDPTGEVLAHTRMGDRAVLAAEIPLRDPPATLMRAWGDWVGGVASAGLLLLGLATVARTLRRAHAVDPTPRPGTPATLETSLAVLTPGWRAVLAALRVAAGAGLLWLAWRMYAGDGWQVNSLAQLRTFSFAVVAPLLLAAAIMQGFAATMRIGNGVLSLQRRVRRIEIPLDRIVAVRRWRLPLPGHGVTLVMQSGRRFGLLPDDPHAFARMLAAADRTPRTGTGLAHWLAVRSDVRAAVPRRALDHPLLKFVAFPLLPALVAFRLHQHIAFGGSFGEAQTYGIAAWLAGLLIWWAAWALGLMLFAAALRVVVEAVALVSRPAAAGRRAIETLVRLVYYLGVPLWLALRLLGG
jgi:apolipoprotein N-acyltransferase